MVRDNSQRHPSIRQRGDRMNEKQLILLREQLQEDLLLWRAANDLPDHQDDVLCDIVLNAFIDAELADQFT